MTGFRGDPVIGEQENRLIIEAALSAPGTATQSDGEVITAERSSSMSKGFKKMASTSIRL